LKKCLLTSIFAAVAALSLNAQVTLSAKAAAVTVIAGEAVEISVSVIDKNDFPADSYQVSLVVLSGGGSISDTKLNLNSRSAGKVMLFTGEKPGNNEVKVYMQGVTPKILAVEGKVSPPAELDINITKNKIYAGRSSSGSVSVRNTLGRAAADINVVIMASGGLRVTPSSGNTSSGGRLSFTVTAGKTPSAAEEIRIRAGQTLQKMERIEVLAPRVGSISLSANPPSVNAGTKTTLKAVVYDDFRIPMSGAKVDFKILNGFGRFFPPQGETDRSGTAFSVLTGGAGENEILVNCEAEHFRSETAKIAVIMVKPPEPASLKASAAHPFSKAEEGTEITVEVLDKNVRPVNGTPVYFLLAAGEGTFSSETAATKDGRASIVFTAGRKAGKNLIMVKCGNLNPVEILIETTGNVKAQRIAGSVPARLEILSYPGSLPLFGSVKLRALVTDAGYNPVEGSAVNFEIISGQGRLFRPRGTTDANGEYSSDVSGNVPGAVKVRAICAGLDIPAEISLNVFFPRLYAIIPLGLLVLFLFIMYLYRKKKIRVADLDNLNRMHSDLFLWSRLRSFILNKKKFKALFFDLKNFGAFSVYFGSEKAETLLKVMGGVIKNECSKKEIYGHLGGDDFIVITARKDYRELASAIIIKIREAILTFYPEQELKRGAVCLVDDSGVQSETELAAPSVAIYNSEKFRARSLNELLEIAGRLEKSAKSAPFPHAAEEVSPADGKDKKRYRIGWFSTGAVFLGLLLCSWSASAERADILSGWAEKQNPYASEKTFITAKLTDDNERPVSNAYLVFRVSEGSGSLERGWAVTGEDGKATIGFIPGNGDNKISIVSGKAANASIGFTARMERLMPAEYFCLAFLVFLLFLLWLKLFSHRLLAAGLDRQTRMRTRMNGDKRIREVLSLGDGLSAAFVEFRDFQAYNGVYGYSKGEKAVKLLARIIRASVADSGCSGDEAFFYGEDKFVVVSSGCAEEIMKRVSSEMDAQAKSFCEEAHLYALEVTASVVDTSVSGAEDISRVMFEAGKLLNDAKKMSGSACAVSGQVITKDDTRPPLDASGHVEAVLKQTEEKEKARQEAEEQVDLESELEERARHAAERLEKEAVLQAEKLESAKAAPENAAANKQAQEDLKKQFEDAEKARAEADEAKRAKEAAELLAKKAAEEAEAQIKSAEAELLALEAEQRKREEEKCLLEEAERAAAAERLRSSEEERLRKELESLDPETRQKRLDEEQKKEDEAARISKLDLEIEKFESLLSGDEGNAEYHERLSELYASRGYEEKAADKLAFLGDAYYEGRYLKNALKYYSGAVDLNPKLVGIRVKISEIYLALGMDREAKLECFNIAESYLNLGDLVNAEAYARKAIEQKSIEARYILGEIYFRKNNFSEAANELELLVKIKPNHQKASQRLLSAYLASGKYKDAFAVLQKALKLESSAGEPAGQVSSREAAVSFCAAIDGIIAKGQYDEAMTLVKEALKYLPDDPAITEKYAFILEKQGTAKEAASAYVRAGDLYTSLQQIEDAKKSYEKASVIDSGNIRESAKAPAAPPPQAAAVPPEPKDKKKPKISYL